MKRIARLAFLIPSTLFVASFVSGAGNASVTSLTATATGSATGTVVAVVPDPLTTNINIGSTLIQTGMKHLGMNIDSQNFYDSGQMMKNLIFRNPGFEGETWQSILHCAQVTANSCTDGNQYAQWPAGFLQGGTYEFITGQAVGQTGTIASSSAAGGNTGIGVQFTSIGVAPAVGDFVVVRQSIPGNATAGWWYSSYGGGALSTETTDLSPNTLGKQALMMSTPNPNAGASLDSYFDSTDTHNFLVLNGPYQIKFRAKGVGGNNQLNVSLGRQVSNGNYFNQTITVTNTWQDYTLNVTLNENPGTAIGTMDLHFAVSGASLYLDDVSLTPATNSSFNPTVFRDEVVGTLLELHPGTLRYMDGLPDFGSSIDNMLAPVSARLRTGSSTQNFEQDDVAMGLHEFLQLCQTVGSEPWYVLPPGMTTTEMQHLMDYLGGATTTQYGAIRASLGQTAPWTTVFPVIHLELGNEQWNYGTFAGNAINDPVSYGQRITAVFGAAKNSPSYSAKSFDLIMGAFILNTYYTNLEIQNGANYDSIAVAPYIFGNFNDSSSTEAIYGPMFAQGEMWDSTPTGYMAAQSQMITAAGKKLVSYEENLGALSGTASQAMVNATVPSVGGGVAMANHMLLQMRDLGVQTQNVWALPGYTNGFNNTYGGQESSPLFGTVVDMGGQANRHRPVFIAEELVNNAILGNMLGTSVTGANPTWNQPQSTNDNVKLANAHYLQTFAFTDSNKRFSLVVVNLSRSQALPVIFSGANAPVGNVTVSQLTSTNITDSNETGANVATKTNTYTNFLPATVMSMPAFSVTTFTWTTP